MGLDLNTADGFGKLTGGLGAVSTVLQQLTGAIQSKWDIDEGSYGHDGKQVLFHVFKTSTDFNAAVGQVQDTGGHRKIPIVFPYQDGQSTDDLGRMGETFDVDILIFGPTYKAQYKKLLKEFDNPVPGTLVHPVRGQITAAPESWVVTHASDKKQAVALRVRFIEHSFSVSYDTIPVAKDVSSALTKAIGFIAAITNLINKIESNLFVIESVKALVSSLMSGYLDGYTNVLTRLNRTFNSGNSSLIPGLNPVVQGQNPDVFNVAADPNNAFAGTGGVQQGQGSEELNTALAAQQAIDQVKNLRTELDSVIAQIEAVEGGQGALIYYDEILSMKLSAIEMQNVLELGLQSSRNTIVNYLTPRDMDVREVCFANGLTPDNSYDIEILNPDLLSLNLIPKNTVVQVPT